jgi:hypothetical protein
MGYPSVFGGQWVAANFAYGAPGGPAALIAYSTIQVPASPPNSQTLNVAFMYTTTIDGITFYPLNTNAPVEIGADSNAEQITPSAVSNNNQVQYGNGSFTAAFVNQHGLGDYIASATFGLQEAINEAHAAGGGKVIIDEQWVKLGGTTAIKNAATLPSGVTITDNR